MVNGTCGAWCGNRLPSVETLESGITPAERPVQVITRPVVYFDNHRQTRPLSVRAALAGRHVMLIGVTGFIGKVWLVNTLMDLPEIGSDLSPDPAAEIESGPHGDLRR